MSQYDLPGLFEFLLHTPESGLRKILVDNKTFTDSHFNLMLKVVRGVDSAKFTEHCDKLDFPKIKMGPAELKIKEKFWGDLLTTCNQRGLLNPAQKVA